MIGFTLEQIKSGFFDREAIQERMDAKMRRVLSRFGAFVRTRDQRSLRYRKGSSAAGQAPSAHRTVARLKTNKKTGETKLQSVSPLREFIFFAATENAGRQSVIAGPVLLNGRRPGVLRIIEEGGEESVKDAKGRTVRRMYRARPHTGPAFEAVINQELPKLLGNE